MKQQAVGQRSGAEQPSVRRQREKRKMFAVERTSVGVFPFLSHTRGVRPMGLGIRHIRSLAPQRAHTLFAPPWYRRRATGAHPLVKMNSQASPTGCSTTPCFGRLCIVVI